MNSLIIRSARRKKKLRWSITNLSVYGAAHAVVDATCAALVLSHLASGRARGTDMAYYVLLYNALAFGLQPLIGLMADKYKRSYQLAIAGCALTAAAAFLYLSPLYSVITAGVGNAMFHVGGGVGCLSLYKGRAAAPGIFVAPGALGLTIGALIGKGGFYNPWSFALLLIYSAAGILFLKQPKVDYSTTPEITFEPYYVILLLLLGSVCIRSLIGFVANYSWKSDKLLLILLTLAVVLGKALGGVLSDKFGWRKVTVSALLLSAPLIAFGEHPVAGILGMFLFNFTMPVTLVAVVNLLPGFPGFAFGMTTLALITGNLIMYLPFADYLSNAWILLILILGSSYMMNRGLCLYLGDCSKVKIKRINFNMRKDI